MKLGPWELEEGHGAVSTSDCHLHVKQCLVLKLRREQALAAEERTRGEKTQTQPLNDSAAWTRGHTVHHAGSFGFNRRAVHMEFKWDKAHTGQFLRCCLHNPHHINVLTSSFITRDVCERHVASCSFATDLTLDYIQNKKVRMYL
jgi:hypothetical protein